jgi:hypothetical protein
VARRNPDRLGGIRPPAAVRDDDHGIADAGHLQHRDASKALREL